MVGLAADQAVVEQAVVLVVAVVDHPAQVDLFLQVDLEHLDKVMPVEVDQMQVDLTGMELAVAVAVREQLEATAGQLEPVMAVLAGLEFLALFQGLPRFMPLVAAADATEAMADVAQVDQVLVVLEEITEEREPHQLLPILVVAAAVVAARLAETAAPASSYLHISVHSAEPAET